MQELLYDLAGFEKAARGLHGDRTAAGVGHEHSQLEAAPAQAQRLFLDLAENVRTAQVDGGHHVPREEAPAVARNVRDLVEPQPELDRVCEPGSDTVLYVRQGALPAQYFDLALQYELKKAGKITP